MVYGLNTEKEDDRVEVHLSYYYTFTRANI